MKKFTKKLVSVLLVISVLASLLAFTASAASPAYGAATINRSTLNIRSKASTSSSVVGTVSSGTKVVLLEKTTETWYKINNRGTVGYVYAPYLKNVTTSKYIKLNCGHYVHVLESKRISDEIKDFINKLER